MKGKKNRQTGILTVAAAVLAAVVSCASPERAPVETMEQNTMEHRPGTETENRESEEIKGKEEAKRETEAKREEETKRETEAEKEEETKRETEAGRQEEIKKPTKREKVKGIYVTGSVAGSAAMEELIALTDQTELNAMVIDVKNDDGSITWKMDKGSIEDTGACVSYIPDLPQLMTKLKEHHIYTIARIVCFKDPYLAEAKPELALKKPDGSPVTDANGLAFVNPCRREVWDYIIEVAEEASRAGFDEIQFDYVRFPIGKEADEADYGVDLQKETKEEIITDFLTYAAERFDETGIVFGADVFGTIIGSADDVERVGQNYKTIGSVADVLSPMVYPSHYANGVFGIEVPDAQPYETVLQALQGSDRELQEIPEESRAVVRPWLQSFTAGWVPGHIPYGGEEIRQQIQAVYDAGYEEWILWNASNHYSADGLVQTMEREG